MPGSNNELTERLKEVLNQKQIPFEQKNKTDTVALSTHNAEIDVQKRQNLISQLENILAKAAKGDATNADVRTAWNINAQLGGEWSSLVATIESAVAQKEALQNCSATSSKPYVDPEVSAAKNYLSTGAVGKSENTLRKIEAGESVKNEDILQTWESLNSAEDRRKRQEFLEDLEKKKKDIFKIAILENRTELKEEEKRRIKEIDDTRLQYIKRDLHDRKLTNYFGQYNKSTAAQLVNDNKQLFKKCIREVATEFKKVEKVVEKETHAFYEHLSTNNSHGKATPDAKKSSIDTFNAKAATLRQEIKKEEVKIVAKDTKKVEIKKEEIKAQSTNELTATQGKTTEGSKKMSAIEAIRAKQAATKASTIPTTEAVKAAAIVIEHANASSISPSRTLPKTLDVSQVKTQKNKSLHGK